MTSSQAGPNTTESYAKEWKEIKSICQVWYIAYTAKGYHTYMNPEWLLKYYACMTTEADKRGLQGTHF